MTVYEKADEKVLSVVEELVNKYYPELKDAGVTIDVLIATNEKSNAVTLGGYKCAAVVRVTKLKDRVKGIADAEIVIDGEAYDGMTPNRKRALIDHELHHLEIQYDDKTGEIKRDDQHRPKLKLKKHDYHFGWFTIIAERYGLDSIEVQQAHHIKINNGKEYQI